MDSTDDDFGELYVDVKVQATAAFAGDVGFIKSCEESSSARISDENMGFDGTVKHDSEGEVKKFGVVCKDSSPCVDSGALNRTQVNEESDYSDSDDDLNIVLKDDDSKAFPVASVPNTNNGGYASAYNACIDPSLGMLQCGYSFSHPWSRSAFEKNLDVFEKKPWRNPGTDISDFFNFGFNEQSWKDYCKPLGRAIEVESGTLDRKPSADMHRPRDSDPDVVIQIPVTNDVEELSSLTPVEARSRSIPSNEASRSQDSHSNNGNGLNSLDDSIKDEVVVGCQDENSGSFSAEQFHPTENFCSREVTPCDKEMVEEEKEEIFWNSDEVDPSLVESESSLGDRIRLSPTSSCSVGKNEESEDCETDSLKDCATDDQREVSTPPRRAGLAEYDTINTKSGERSGTKHSRHTRSHKHLSKRHCGRAEYDVHGRIKHRIVKDASHTPDAYLGKKVRSQHGSLYRDSNKNWQNGPRSSLERHKTEGKGFLHSNIETCHGRRVYSSVNQARHREHRFGWNNSKDFSRGQGFDHSNGHKYEARSSFNAIQRNYPSSIKEKDDRYGRHHSEKNYGHERSPDLAYESNKERNRYDQLREPYYQDGIPLNDMDYRYQLEYSSAHGNPRQSHENDLHSRRRGDREYKFHLQRYEDGVHRAESGIPFELTNREMHSFTAVGRREFQRYERNERFSEIDKRHHYRPDWHLDRFVSEKDDYEYKIRDPWPAPSLPLRDSWYERGSRRDSWKDDTRDFTTTEAYDSQNNQLYKASARDGWTRNFEDSDYVSIQDRLTYEDDWFHRDRGRYQLTDDIQCSMREVTHCEHPSYTDDILSRNTRMPTHNRLSTKQRSGYFKSHIHEADERDHRSKKLRRDGHAFAKCQDPVDLTGRQGKYNQSELSNKSKKRFSNGVDIIEQQDHKKPRKLRLQVGQIGTDKEEGEILEEARNVEDIELNDERIQKSLKKMEKRRERFKETELTKTVKGTFESQTEQSAKTDDTNQQRPVRKRRWCAS